MYANAWHREHPHAKEKGEVVVRALLGSRKVQSVGLQPVDAINGELFER